MRLVSRRARLLDFETYQIGNALHMRFLYDTGDAAGQNMTTATTWKACQWILAQTSYYLGINIKQFMVEANMSGDKKVNYLSFISGRGIRVTAEAVISEEVLKSVLKVSSDELADATHIFMSGSLKAGMIGFNINIANTIAAIFVATGQDIACVHESSIGQLDIKKHGDGIYVSLLLPSLIIGTVGGGTGLPTQQDCLKIMGCQGTHKVNRLAEIIAGYCLALDLSTLAAIASGQFASAHEKLGRNHPEDGLKESHLTPEFFDTMLQNIPQFATVPGLHVTKLKSLSLDTQNSILSELTSTSLRKKVGHFAYDVHWEDLTTSGIRRIVIKAKPTDSEVINMVNSMAQGCGNKLARIYELFKKDTGFYKCHIREMEIYRLENEHVKRYMPEVFYTWRDDDHEIFAIAMEYLEDVLLKDTVMDIEAWSDEHIRAVLRDLAELHAVFLDQTEPLKTNDWMKPMSRDAMINMMPLWNEMLIHSSEEFPLLMPQERKELMSKIIDAIPEFWSTLEAAPWTLIHNDFNPRNICLRKTGKRFRLCAYDWELSTLNVPQHDLAEFLAFILPPGTSNERRLELIHYYREVLVEKTGKSMEAENFMKVYNAACFDFAVNRIQMYLMAHTFKDYQFLPRVLDSHFEYIKTIMR
jgi:aminoglycoside phosphotransferase (APT) family kinase protein